jgi:hypothetical protein
MGRISRFTVSSLFAAGSAGAATQQSIIPEQINPPSGQALSLIVAAKGVQIYECRKSQERAGAWEWTFIAPSAELYDTTGAKIGRHYGGPSWESADGSKVVGTTKGRAEAPAAGAIPWLLLETKSVAQQGAFSKVTSIQRVNTAGGMAPKVGCSESNAGTPVRVPYTADYYFFTAK